MENIIINNDNYNRFPLSVESTLSSFSPTFFGASARLFVGVSSPVFVGVSARVFFGVDGSSSIFLFFLWFNLHTFPLFFTGYLE